MTTLVLSVGNDSTLLAIRKLMLADAGYTVVSALGAQEFVNKLFDGDFDVVVLCTSLAPVERRKMAAVVRQHRPSTRIFALSADGDGKCDGADSTICGDTADLVRALAALGPTTATQEGAGGRVA
jgi:CheY-like chemotaxis protein